MKKKILNAILWSLLYVVAFFVADAFGFLHPFLWVYFGLIAAVLTAYPYVKLCKNHRVFGMALLPVLFLMIAFYIVKEFDGQNMQLPIVSIAIALAAEGMRRFIGGYNSEASVVSSYCLLALIPTVDSMILWLRPEYVLKMTENEMGEKYMEQMEAVSQIWILLLVTLVIVILAFASAIFVNRKTCDPLAIGINDDDDDDDF